MEQTHPKNKHPEFSYRHATKDELRMIADFSAKLHHDFHKNLELTLQLVMPELGSAGAYAILQKFLGTIATGTSMTFTAMRTGPDPEKIVEQIGAPGENHKHNADDLLFVCLLAYTSAQEQFHNAVETAYDMFEKIRGYKPERPYGWGP